MYVKDGPGLYIIFYFEHFSDCRRGQSLVVHAINEGRQAAREIDMHLMGHTSLAGPGGIVHEDRYTA
jgi:glutamate synthase (NADPH/NADH)